MRALGRALLLGIASVLAASALVVAIGRGGEDRGPGGSDQGGTDPVSVADAELPLRREWGGLSCVSLDRIRRVASPRAQGRWAHEIRIEDGDTPTTENERCELTQGTGYRLPGTSVPAGARQFAEDEDRWIAFQVRVGADWDADTDRFNNFMQLKSDGSGGPPLKMAIDDGRIELGGIADSERSAPNFVTLWSTPFKPDHRDRWLKFLLHVRFSPDEEEGSVELYGDPGGRGVVPLLRRTSLPTMKVDDDEAIAVHPRIGIYRDRDVSGPARVWFDGYTVARSREAAERVAFAPRL